MTTWGDLRDRVVESLGEFDNQAAAAATGATFSDATIYKRMGEKYKWLYRKALSKGPEKFVSHQTFSYTAGAEYIDLEGIPPESLRWRPLLRVEDYREPTRPYTIRPMTEHQWRNHLDDGWRYNPGVSDWSGLTYYVEGEKLYLLPKPGSALALRVAYLPAATAPTTDDSGDEPTLFPDEFHELIAIEAAISFHNATGMAPQGLLMERQALYQEFMAWASESLEARPRYVHEAY